MLYVPAVNRRKGGERCTGDSWNTCTQSFIDLAAQHGMLNISEPVKFRDSHECYSPLLEL